MYPSHGGTQAGRVQSDPTGDPFVCGQCSTTGKLSIRSGLSMFQVLPVTVTSNQVVVMHHMPGLPVRVGVPVLARVEALAQLPRPVRRLPAQGTQRSLRRTSNTSQKVNIYTYTLHVQIIASTLVE